MPQSNCGIEFYKLAAILFRLVLSSGTSQNGMCWVMNILQVTGSPEFYMSLHELDSQSPKLLINTIYTKWKSHLLFRQWKV